MPLPLEGVKVIDLTHYIAGPYCTKLLADYGADVIKIERPDGGDPARRIGPFFHDEPHLEGSGLFLHLNTNKRSVTLNLKTEAGRSILLDAGPRRRHRRRELLAAGDAVAWDSTYEALEAVNPRLVMTSISNFGQTGPYRDYKMTRDHALRHGRHDALTGIHDREPVKLGMTRGAVLLRAWSPRTATMGAYPRRILPRRGAARRPLAVRDHGREPGPRGARAT